MNENETEPETKDQQETQKPELLVLKTRYSQHASFSMQPACSDVITNRAR
jgi:hypothetical protein